MDETGNTRETAKRIIEVCTKQMGVQNPWAEQFWPEVRIVAVSESGGVQDKIFFDEREWLQQVGTLPPKSRAGKKYSVMLLGHDEKERAPGTEQKEKWRGTISLCCSGPSLYAQLDKVGFRGKWNKGDTVRISFTRDADKKGSVINSKSVGCMSCICGGSKR